MRQVAQDLTNQLLDHLGEIAPTPRTQRLMPRLLDVAQRVQDVALAVQNIVVGEIAPGLDVSFNPTIGAFGIHGVLTERKEVQLGAA